MPVHPHATGDGGVEQDPEELWTSVLDAGRQAVAAAGVPVGAVGLANQGETVLAWDRASGRPLSRGDLVAGSPRAGRLRARCASTATGCGRITGLPLDPYFAAPKMRWLREQVTRAGRLHDHRHLAAASPLRRLRHRRRDRVAHAAARPRRGAWSAEACALFDLDRARLPDDRAVRRRRSARPTAFGGTLPVAGLAVDQQAALFAEACLDAGEAKCTYGTGAFLLATVGPRPRRSTRRAGRLRRLAARRRDHLLPRRPGLHRRRGGELAAARAA